MYNTQELQSCLTSLIGYEPVQDAEAPAIDADLLESTSGTLIGPSLHPLLSYTNIWAIAEQYSKITPPAYSAGTNYPLWALVVDSAIIYESRINGNTGNTPATSPDQWRATNLYSAFLRKMYNASIVKLFSRLATEKKLAEAGKSLLDKIHLFEGVGNINGRITKNSRFVGLKLTLVNPDTIARLTHIALQLDTAQEIDIYIFHSSQREAITVLSLTTTKSISMQWLQIVTQVLSFMSDDTGNGGSYYIGYYEDELTGQAVKKEISFIGGTPCSHCSEATVNRNLFVKWSKFLKISPFYVNSNDLDDTPGILWDEEKEFILDSTNWGINLQLSVQCDLSRWICANSNVIIEPLSRQIVVDFLKEMTFSLRSNQNKERIAALAAVALDNQENGMYGEAKELSDAIKALSFDFSNLSGVCTPCNNAGAKPRMSSVWGR